MPSPDPSKIDGAGIPGPGPEPGPGPACTCLTVLPVLFYIQGDSGGLGVELGRCGFEMFHYPAWAVGSYSSQPALGTSQI